MGNEFKSIETAPMTPLVRKIALFTIGGMIVDGYIVGNIGVPLTIAAPELDMSSTMTGAIGSASLFGILVGSILGGKLSDKFGRKWVLIVDLVLFVIVSLCMLAVSTSVLLLTLRLLLGIVIGVEYSAGGTLLAEVVPAHRRGSLLGALNVGFMVGSVGAYAIMYLLKFGGVGWQTMLATSAIPAFVVVLLRIGTPESPRWLFDKGYRNEAFRVVQKWWGSAYGTESLAKTETPKVGYRLLFSREYVRRTLFAGLFWACQVMPGFAIIVFLPQFVGAIGISNEFGGTMAGNAAQLGGTILGVFAIAIFSRRGLVIWSFVIGTGGLVVISFVGTLPTSIIVASFVIYLLVMTAATNLEFVYPSEVFPTEVRATGVGFATAVSRLGSSISTFFLPILLAGLGSSVTLLVLASITAVGACVSALWAPETKGMSLEQASRVE